MPNGILLESRADMGRHGIVPWHGRLSHAAQDDPVQSGKNINSLMPKRYSGTFFIAFKKQRLQEDNTDLFNPLVP